MPKKTLQNAPRLDRLIPMPEVRTLTSLSKASIYRQVGEKTFPAPRKIGKSRVAWLQSDIAAWIARQETT